MTENTESNMEAEASRRRELLAYRVVVGVLLFVVVALVVLLRGCARSPDAGFFPPAGQPAGVPQGGSVVEVLDVAARVAEITSTRPDSTDTSETYFSSAVGTVHLHVVGFEQTVPLHIHRKTHEATVIVTGEPEVTQIFGRDGHAARIEGVRGPGTLIYSPPYTGHKWVNRAMDAMQGNLVFAAPAFTGNFYVEENDPRMLEGGEPFIYDPDDALEKFLADVKTHGLEPLPVMDGQLSSLLVRDRAVFDPGAGPVMAFVTRGEGTLHANGAYPIRSGRLVSIPPHTPVEIEAGESSPLAILVFKPLEGSVPSVPAFEQ